MMAESLDFEMQENATPTVWHFGGETVQIPRIEDNGILFEKWGSPVATDGMVTLLFLTVVIICIR